jgi:hypothetical protein
MRDFIKNKLSEVRDKKLNSFDYQYKCDDGEIISMKGTVKDGRADFEITRTKANEHCCSRVPVFGMPLTTEYFTEIAKIAVEAL